MPPALLFFFKIVLAFWSLMCSTCLKAKCLNKLFGIILHWRLVFCPPFIYLFSHLCQYELMDIYFIISVVIQYCFIYFVAQIISVLATGKGTQLAPMSLRYMLSLCGFALLCVLFVQQFLIFWLYKALYKLQAHLLQFLFQLWNQPFIQGNHDLGTWCTFCPLSVYYNILQCM